MKDTIYYFLHDYLLYMIFFYFFVLFLIFSKKNSNTQNVEIKRSYMDYFTKRKYSKPFTVDEKKNYSQKMKESKIKGDNYEIYVAEHYKSIGYEVSLNGIIHGKKDNGIDIICNKNNELILIQCKNWKENSKYKVTHLILKAFIGCCSEYIIKNQLFNKKVAFHFVTSNNILDASAKKYLAESTTLKYEILPFN